MESCDGLRCETNYTVGQPNLPVTFIDTNKSDRQIWLTHRVRRLCPKNPQENWKTFSRFEVPYLVSGTLVQVIILKDLCKNKIAARGFALCSNFIPARIF